MQTGEAEGRIDSLGRGRWLAAAGTLGLALAWGGLALALVGGAGGAAPASAPRWTGAGALVALACGLLHPRRGWTFALILGGGVFVGLFGGL